MATSLGNNAPLVVGLFTWAMTRRMLAVYLVTRGERRRVPEQL